MRIIKYTIIRDSRSSDYRDITVLANIGDFSLLQYPKL